MNISKNSNWCSTWWRKLQIWSDCQIDYDDYENYCTDKNEDENDKLDKNDRRYNA